MSLNNLKSELLEIVDPNPLWIKHLDYNPISDIVKIAKPYHLLSLVKDVFGAKESNPVISNIKYFHYKEIYVEKIFEDLAAVLGKVENIGNENREMEIISLLAKIDYFKAYNKKYTDLLVKEVIQTNLFNKITFLSHQAMLITLIYRLGHGNIYLERYFKHLEESQNDDGGWAMSYGVEKTDLFSTLIIYHVFTKNNLWINKNFVIKAEEYLTENHLSENQTNEELDRWNRIYTGYKKNNLFEGGSVLLLEGFLLSNRKENMGKIKSIILWLKSLQLKTGYFPYHSTLKAQKNISATIKILHLIKTYYLKK